MFHILLDEGVCDDTVLGNVRYVGMGHDNHSICPLLARFVVALTHHAEVFSKCCHPNLCSGWIIHELAIATDGCSGDGVNHRRCITLKVNRGGRVVAKIEECVVNQILVQVIQEEVVDGVLVCYFPGHSFFQTRCTTIDGQTLYNFVNKKTLYFTLP